MGRLFVLFFPGQFIKDLFSLHKKTLSLVRVQIASTGMYLVWKGIVWTTVHLCVKQYKPLSKNCWSLFLTILLLLTQIWRWGRWGRGGDRSAPHCSRAFASGPWPCAKNYYYNSTIQEDSKSGLFSFPLLGMNCWHIPRRTDSKFVSFTWPTWSGWQRRVCGRWCRGRKLSRG